MNLRSSVLALVLIAFVAAMTFATGAEEVGADGPMEIVWGGLPKNQGGVAYFPTEDAIIVQELNEFFGVKLIPWETNPGNAQEVGLAIAAGDIPDFIMTGANIMIEYMDQGLFREVPWEMVQENAPFMANAIEERVGLETYQTYPNWVDGTMYGGFPSVGPEFFMQHVIRTDWLEAVGLDQPTNLDEFAEVVRAFTFDDPDGNGEDDTYGMMLSSVTSGYLDEPISAAFGLGGSAPIAEVDGEWVPQEISQPYREFLSYLKMLWDEGVVHPDLSLGNKEFQPYFTDGTVGYMTDTWTWVLPYYRPTGWFASLFVREPTAEASVMDAFREPELTYYSPGPSHWRYMMVTKDVSDAKTAQIYEILDVQLTNMEIHNLIWDGIEGTHFTFSDDDGRRMPVAEYSSGDAFTDIGQKFFINNSRITEETLTYSFGGVVQDLLEFQSTWNRVEIPLGPSFVSEVRQRIGADLDTIANEFKWQAITGEVDLDDDWDAYVEDWLRAGGQDYIDEYTDYLESL